jgi:PIN domain nuclease of toxin-antitoxin system
MNCGYLLDTHTWLWWNGSPDKLSPRVKAIIEDTNNQIFFSIASAWEIAIKVSIGKLGLPEAAATYIPQRLADNSFTALAIQLPHILIAGDLPLLHRDPFDRILVAQAKHERLVILSIDHLIAQYQIPVIWK